MGKGVLKILNVIVENLWFLFRNKLWVFGDYI